MDTQGRECPGQAQASGGGELGGRGDDPRDGIPRGREAKGDRQPARDLAGVRRLENFQEEVFGRSRGPRSEAQGRSLDGYREGR